MKQTPFCIGNEPRVRFSARKLLKALALGFTAQPTARGVALFSVSLFCLTIPFFGFRSSGELKLFSLSLSRTKLTVYSYVFPLKTANSDEN